MPLLPSVFVMLLQHCVWGRLSGCGVRHWGAADRWGL